MEKDLRSFGRLIMATKKSVKKEEPKTEPTQNEKWFALADYTKYNLYLLNKAIIFHGLVTNGVSPDEAVAEANRIINELDLVTKAELLRRNQAQ